MSPLVLTEIVAGRAPAVLPLTVDQYHRMIAQGILREGEAGELLDGVLVHKNRSDRGGAPMSHGPRHALSVKLLPRALCEVERLGHHLQTQLPVTLGPTQEPEPDGALIRGQPEDYLTRHPGPGDILAVIEVADSSLEHDRTTKHRLYAASSIPYYWIVNIPDSQIEVHEQPDPDGGRYTQRRNVRAGESLVLESGGVRVEVAARDLLPVTE